MKLNFKKHDIIDNHKEKSAFIPESRVSIESVSNIFIKLYNNTGVMSYDEGFNLKFR